MKKLDIIYEDKNILVINKPAKLLTIADNKERVKVCLDTCHLNDAGYDLTNFDELLDSFDQIIGINKPCY